MMQKLLVDYHFHPNLSKHTGRARRRCQLIWEQFSRRGVAVAIITEHVFKNPARAYRLLQATKPADATTIIFPGIEALTKEGADIIVFAETEIIYTHKLLMVPKQLSVLAMADYIHQQSDIYGSIAHPFLVGHSGIIRRVGLDTTLAAMQKLGGVETSNACFRGMKRVVDALGISHVLPRQRRLMDWVSHLPNKYIHDPHISLCTGGSDAHLPIEIGSGQLVLAPTGTERAAVFQAIITNRSTEFYELPAEIRPLLAVYKLYSIASEMAIKAFRLYEGKIYQHDDQFTNFYSEAEKETVLEIRRRRVEILKPILNFLTYIGVTPVVLNIVSSVSISASLLLLAVSPPTGLILFIAYAVGTALVSSLARYQNKETEAGAITKIILYQLGLVIGILVAIARDWTSGLWGALYLVLYIIMLWLTITLNKVGQPIRLVLRSKNLILLTIFVTAFSPLNLITESLVVFSIYMAIINSWMVRKLYWALQSTPR